MTTIEAPAKPKASAKPKTSTKPKTPAKPKMSKEPNKSTKAKKSNEDPKPKPKRKRQETKTTTAAEPDRKILVAVDFGTTFSGIAWAQTRKPESRTQITQWPDASDSLQAVSSDKVPTEIVNDGENYKWGFQIQDCVQRQKWFKLDLDPSQVRDSPLISKYHDSLAAPPSYDSVEKLVKNYLTALREHTERTLRHSLPESALLSTPIEYIVTVPAVWSDMAQAKTRACAEAAGMGAGAALHVISEPEAAALCALSEMDTHDLKVGDTYVVCDAGGGTVDLITYTISALEPILELTEASPGTGSLCGGSILNRIFAALMEEKLGHEVGWDEEALEEAMKRFESVVKRQFRGTFGEEFQIPVPGLSDNNELGIRKNRMTLAGTEVRAIFEPVLKEVLRLVTGQINATEKHVKAVILVGGFGQNAYLRDSIRNEIKSSKIEVYQSPNSWTAVVRGALMKGLASTSPAFSTVGITGRAARKHYGINVGMEYHDLEHDHTNRVWDAFDGFYRIYMMDWFIKKGSLVKEGDPLRLTYRQTRLVSRGPFTTISTAIYCSSDPMNSGAPKYVEDESVTQLVIVEADLSRIPTKMIPQRKGADGKMYYNVHFAIQVTYMSAYTSYELVYAGVNYGHIKSEYV